MRTMFFLNNAAFTLTGALTDEAFTGQPVPLTADRPSSWPNMPEAMEGLFTLATITHKDMPGQYEIVNLLGYVDMPDDSRVLMVERAREDTQAQAWPVGAVMECRVTASMLEQLSAATLRHARHRAISVNYGDAFVNWGAGSGFEFIPGAYALGGLPVAPARGFGEPELAGVFTRMAQQVEGVGYSHMVELGVAPDYNPATTYYPGDFVKSTDSPFNTYCMGRGNAFSGDAAPALGESPWVRFDPGSDSNIVAFPRLGAGGENFGIWFYPTEIGFICDAYGASTPPTVTVKEVDYSGSVVGDLVTAKQLVGVGARQRIVLSSTITKGIKGFHFVRSSTATGGTCRGRFYWKGLFVHSNDADSYPAAPDSFDGLYIR